MDGPEAEFNRAFVRDTIARCLDVLEQRNSTHARIIRDLLANNGRTSEGLAEELGKDANSMRVARYRAKKAFEEICAEHFRSTTRDEDAARRLLDLLDDFFP